jgi:hypothetical protein
MFGKEGKIQIETPKDLIPYYPYTISMAGSNKDHSFIYLSSQSYPDHAEEEMLELIKSRLLRAKKGAKRKKETFNPEEAAKKLGFFSNLELIKELARRVAVSGDKADYSDLHMDTYDFYREFLVEEMKENGLDPREYGYGRFVEN